MQYAMRDFMHNLAGTMLVPRLGYALRGNMHYELMHYEIVNCILATGTGLVPSQQRPLKLVTSSRLAVSTDMVCRQQDLGYI